MKNTNLGRKVTVISILLCLVGFSTMAQYNIIGVYSATVGNTYTYSCTRANGAWPSAGGTVWSIVGGTILTTSIDPQDKIII
jgi:hypothetical protein